MSVIACPAVDAREASATTPRRPPSLRPVVRFAALAAAGLISASNVPFPPYEPAEARPPFRTAEPDKMAGLGRSDTGFVAATGAAALAVNRRRAFDGRLERAGPFRFPGAAADFENAVDCLAAAAYYEAGDDPSGQAAVAQVVINRLRHPAYPSSLCAVVFEGSRRRTGCQFTFTCDGSLARKPTPAAWERARTIAIAALSGRVDARVGTATHYHADYVLPHWAASLRKLTQIGAHIFYRWPGKWGSNAVLRDPNVGRESKIAALGDAYGQDVDISVEADIQPLALGEAPELTALSYPPQPVTMPDSTILTIADHSLPPGRWAINAMDDCGNRDACLVLAYGDADALQRNRASDPASREAPVFLFVRDSSSGVNLALWDCTRVQRPSSTQCLPSSRPALARLLRDRG